MKSKFGRLSSKCPLEGHSEQGTRSESQQRDPNFTGNEHSVETHTGLFLLREVDVN